MNFVDPSGLDKKVPNSAKCPGRVASAVNSSIIRGAGSGPAAAAQLLATATGHVITIGYDATMGFRLGTFGGNIHGGYSFAFDPQGNIALISTSGAGGGGFGGDVGITGQMGDLQNTSVFSLQPYSSTEAFSLAVGDGLQGQFGTDLAGNINLGVGPGGGFSMTANTDISTVTIMACQY